VQEIKRRALAVNFQEVVHSARTANADVARQRERCLSSLDTLALTEAAHLGSGQGLNGPSAELESILDIYYVNFFSF